MKRYNPKRDSNIFNINSGTIIFSIIAIYIIIRVIISLQVETLSIYEVQNSYIDTNINTTALILRQETIVNSDSSGYVSYYVRDGEKIGKSKTVYTIDETGSIYDKIKDSDSEGITMSNDGLKEERTRISNFENYFNYSDFSDVYNFRYDIENAVLELTNEAMIEKLTSLDGKTKGISTYKKVSSFESGIITYYKDGYENISIENFKASDVDNTKYKKQTLKTGEIINSGDPVYKLVTSENWQLILPISDKDAYTLKDKDHLTINIHNSSKNISSPVKFVNKDGKHFAILSLDEQMVNYINDRFIDVVIIMDQNDGLKIPNTSITKKEAYEIPASYLTNGSDSLDKIYLNIKALDKKGELTVKQEAPDIIKKDEKFIYIDPNDFPSDTVIYNSNTNESLQLSSASKKELDGVFCVNQGVAKFRYIDITYQDDDYTIVKNDVPYSIARYDRIVLNQALVSENQIIK